MEEEEEEAYLRTSPAPLPLLSLSSFPSCLVRLSSPTHLRRIRIVWASSANGKEV